MSVYEAGRDLVRARDLEWHAKFAIPSIWKFWGPNREPRLVYYGWTNTDEVSWKHFVARYMRLINDYKSIGGRVAAGTDAGFIYSLSGFAAIRDWRYLRRPASRPTRRSAPTRTRRRAYRAARGASRSSASSGPASSPTS